MKLFWIDQQTKFKKHLDFLSLQSLHQFEKTELKEKTTTIHITPNKAFDQIDLDFFYNYTIFPPRIMKSKGKWQEENRKMEKGDTIVQQIYFPPIRFFSQKIIVGVRINEVINQNEVKLFSYQTIEGHVEKGVSTFKLEQLEDKIIFSITTFSSLGNFLTKLLAPIFSVPYQAYCTRQCLNFVKQQIECQ